MLTALAANTWLARFTGVSRWCPNFSIYRVFSLLLLAAFVLAACEPVQSSLGPPKKTEAQALQALETATEELGTKVNAEIDARAKYVQAATDAGQPVEIVLRLLRRIVVLAVTKADVERLLQEWRAAKKAVKEVQKKIETLITALETDYGAEAKNEAKKAKENVEKVVTAVKEVRQAKSVGAINTAENKVKAAVTTAKETVKNAKNTAEAKETAKKNEEAKKEAEKAAGLLRRGDLIYSVPEGTSGAFYKLTAGGPVKLGKPEVALLYKFYYVAYIGGLTDYVVIPDRSERRSIARIYVRRKSGGPETLVKTHSNVGVSP